MIKLSGSYTGSAYYDLNDPFNTGFSEIKAQVRSVHIKYYNLRFIREGIYEDSVPDGTGIKKEQLLLYDHTGQIHEERIASKDGFQLTRKFYIYDKRNKLVEIDIFGDDQALHEKWIFRYDSHGRNTEQEHFITQSTLSEKWKFTFDTQSKLVEESKYGNNILLEKWTFRKTGPLTSEQCRFISDGTPDEKWESAYDNHGKRTSAKRYLRDGLHFETYRFAYDEHGNLTEEIIENEAEQSRNTRKYDYVYDSRGNWTCMIESLNNEPRIMIKRSIRYLEQASLKPYLIEGLHPRNYTSFNTGLKLN